MIQVSNLTRYYGSLPALRNVSFEVQRGEIIGLLGLNGAGKSTALKILAGVLAPSNGFVSMNGQNVTDNADKLKSKIGFLPEEPPLYRDMTVTAFIVHVGRLKGMTRQQALARLPEVIRITGLQGRENQLIGTLSHGYKKRVGIAMTVIHDPELVILDEPISGLDPKQIKEMRGVIRRLGDKRAVLISSHILSEISKTCDRLIVLDQGKMVAQGSQEDLTSHLGNTQIKLTVRGNKGDFTAWLDRHPLVKSSKAVEAPEDCTAAIIKLDGDEREALAKEVMNAGFGLRLMEDPEYDLEEVFLRFTGGPAPLSTNDLPVSADLSEADAPTEEINS